MKSIYALLFFFSGAVLQVTAQKNQPAFGKVEKGDLLMTDCDFDKGADAVILIDWGSTFYDRGTVGYSTFKTVLQRRIRIKILKEKGISQADVEIPFYIHNKKEQVLDLKANTYNIDGSGNIGITEVKKSSIYSKKINDYYSKMIIAFPEVKVGSIIEYAYTMVRETIKLTNWYFQGRIPVRFSGYQLKIPQIFRFTVQPSVVDPIEDKQEVIDEILSASEGVIETRSLKSNYSMRNLPGIKDEPFMGSARDYMQRLEFHLTQIYYSETHIEDLSLTWNDVIKKDLNENENFGLQLKKSVYGTSDLVEAAKKIPDDEARMKFVFNQVRQTIIWNERFGIYVDNGISKTWETKTGNAADINLLLIKILHDAGIKATPILFSTRQHGLVSPYYPGTDQFNTVMAYVEIKDDYFVLDATDKLSHYTLLPQQIVNTRGFILEGQDGIWKDVLSGKKRYRVITAIKGEIDGNGLMKGSGLVNCYDYARIQRCASWLSNKERFKNDYFIKYYPALQIEEVIINNLETDSLPLEQKVKFSSVLNSSGDYRYFSVNIFSDLEENPFVAKTRVSDLDFGVQQNYIIFGNFSIPHEYSFDGIPESISMSTADRGIVFNRSVQVEANLLNVRMTLEFNHSFYPAGSYPEIAAFYKKLFDVLNEQVVIKKKVLL